MEPLFTCVTCHVGFPTAEDQRVHYKGEWHRYNLKRKVASFKPVSEEEFKLRVAAQQSKEKEEADKASYQAQCTVCNKVYSSENAYNNHLNSKKHKEALANPPQVQPKKEKSVEDSKPVGTDVQMTDASKSEDEMDEIDRKIAESRRLATTECLFCPHNSNDFESNLLHMTKEHSFFIPDLEYLTDPEGLITYLGEKVSVGNVCLYCNGKGRGFRSLEAVQKHMVDKGHCKIYYEDDAEDELFQFYDFRPSYPDYDPKKASDDVVEANEDAEVADQSSSTPVIHDESLDLILPNGSRLSHRALRRYYKQRILPDRPVQVKRLVNEYRAIGWKTALPEERVQMKKFLRDRQRSDMWLGVKSNTLFVARPQVIF